MTTQCWAICCEWHYYFEILRNYHTNRFLEPTHSIYSRRVSAVICLLNWFNPVPTRLYHVINYYVNKTYPCLVGTRLNWFMDRVISAQTSQEEIKQTKVKSRGPILRVTSSETHSVCVKHNLNTRRSLVIALVTWHVSYKITTLYFVCRFLSCDMIEHLRINSLHGLKSKIVSYYKWVIWYTFELRSFK